MLVAILILFVKYVIHIKVDVIKILVFLSPAYVIILIESLTSYEFKAMTRIMTKDAFMEWLMEIMKCRPTLRSGGVKDAVILYDQCMDLTENSKFLEKMKKINGVLYLELDLCLSFKDVEGGCKIIKKEANIVNQFMDNNSLSPVVKCCCFNLSSSLNRPIATLENFVEHVLICSGRQLWMRNVVFTLCTVFLLSWPYRLLWNGVTVKKELQIVKQIIFSVV